MAGMAGDTQTPCPTVLWTLYHFPMMLGQSDNVPQLYPTEGLGTVIPTREHKNPELLRGRLGLLDHKVNFVFLAEHFKRKV